MTDGNHKGSGTTDCGWIGPCAHGRCPYDRCEVCGEMSESAAKELAEVTKKVIDWGNGEPGRTVPLSCEAADAIRAWMALTEEERDEVCQDLSAEQQLYHGDNDSGRGFQAALALLRVASR